MKTSTNEQTDQATYYIAESALNYKLAEIEATLSTINNSAKTNTLTEISRLNSLPAINPEKANLNSNYLTTYYLNELTNSLGIQLPGTDNYNSNLFVTTLDNIQPNAVVNITTSATPLEFNLESNGNIKSSRKLQQKIAIKAENVRVGDYILNSPSPPQISNPIDLNIAPFYFFNGDTKLSVGNNWSINGVSKKGNTVYDTLPNTNISYLNDVYLHHKKYCKEKENSLPKSTSNLVNGQIKNPGLYYVNIPNLNSSDFNLSIDNPNKHHVDLIYCNVEKIGKVPSFNITGQNVNIFIISDYSLITNNVHASNLSTNIFYAPKLETKHFNGNGQTICTTFYINSLEALNGSGDNISNACTGYLPTLNDPIYNSESVYVKPSEIIEL